MQTALQELATGTATSSGDIQLIFPPVKESRVWTGSIVIGSSSGLTLTSKTIAPIQWEAKDSGNTIGKWFNDLPSPTMQARGQVIVTGNNIANTEILQGRYYGVQTDLNDTPIVWPTPPPPPPPSVPKVIVSNNVPLPAGTTQIGSNQPVVVGTSLEIFECITAPLGGGNTPRLAIQWSVDGSFISPIEWNIDLPATGTFRGLILPNLGPWVRFLGLSGGQEQISLTVLTGLAPIARSPIMPLGVLVGASFVSLGAGDTIIALPTYVGQAMISAELGTATANALDVHLTHTDYQGFVQAQGPWKVSSELISGNTVNIPPFLVYLPPRLNTLTISNRTAGPFTGSYCVTPIGP